MKGGGSFPSLQGPVRRDERVEPADRGAEGNRHPRGDLRGDLQTGPLQGPVDDEKAWGKIGEVQWAISRGLRKDGGWNRPRRPGRRSGREIPPGAGIGQRAHAAFTRGGALPLPSSSVPSGETASYPRITGRVLSISASRKGRGFTTHQGGTCRAWRTSRTPRSSSGGPSRSAGGPLVHHYPAHVGGAVLAGPAVPGRRRAAAVHRLEIGRPADEPDEPLRAGEAVVEGFRHGRTFVPPEGRPSIRPVVMISW